MRALAKRIYFERMGMRYSQTAEAAFDLKIRARNRHVN